MGHKIAVVAGGTGLIGRHLVDTLVRTDAYDRVKLLVRGPIEPAHQKLQVEVVDFDHLGAHADAVRGDDLFCCLGTTIRKAGSQAAFRRVDCTYPHELAKLGFQEGASQYLLVTAMGADPTSSIFYNRVKGDVEHAVRSVPYRSTLIFRPSLLLGSRNEARPGEAVAQAVMQATQFLMIGPLRTYRPIHARVVAETMAAAALENLSGVHIFASDQITAFHDAHVTPSSV